MGARFLAEAALNLPLIHDVMAQCCCWPRTQPSTSNLQHCIRRGRLVYTTHVFVRYCGYALVKERVSRDLGKSGAQKFPPFFQSPREFLGTSPHSSRRVKSDVPPQRQRSRVHSSLRRTGSPNRNHPNLDARPELTWRRMRAECSAMETPCLKSCQVVGATSQEVTNKKHPRAHFPVESMMRKTKTSSIVSPPI
jgi:hypothetical protein